MEPRSGYIIYLEPPSHPTSHLANQPPHLPPPQLEIRNSNCFFQCLQCPHTNRSHYQQSMCSVPPPIILVLCSVPPMILDPSWMINLAQLVSSSVALPAELVFKFVRKNTFFNKIHVVYNTQQLFYLYYPFTPFMCRNLMDHDGVGFKIGQKSIT